MIRPTIPAGLLLCLLLAATPQASEPAMTGGAAPGYVDDALCARCHRGHYESFQHVGMAQSFKRPGNAVPIERFGETFFHEPSQRYYEIHEHDGGLRFRRYQRDRDGNVINEVQFPIDWVLGSGNRTRSYVYHNDHGELFQLPIGWYSEGQHWEMSPGFESRDHDGLGRKLTRECMFCHNAYPDSELDGYADPELFPAELPEGIGCQRCHGPGGEHVTAATADHDLAPIRGAIVNPGKLSGAVQDSVCMQCHLLPAIAVVGPRKFGRGDYSFRPGELLTDYMVHLDVRERGVPEPERFEINHHGYRMLKSACYRESGGELGCISCHDPHAKPDTVTFRRQVAGVCRDCHGEVAHDSAAPVADCVSCHMPARRTRDVIHVTMTDHWIARGPFDAAALVAPIQAETRQISDVRVLDFGSPPGGLDAQAYTALGRCALVAAWTRRHSRCCRYSSGKTTITTRRISISCEPSSSSVSSAVPRRGRKAWSAAIRNCMWRAPCWGSPNPPRGTFRTPSSPFAGRWRCTPIRRPTSTWPPPTRIRGNWRWRNNSSTPRWICARPSRRRTG